MNWDSLLNHKYAQGDPDAGLDPFAESGLYNKFSGLDDLLQGTPDWTKVEGECEALFKRTRHLRVLVVWTAAALWKHGLPGANQALAFLCANLGGGDPEDRRWLHLYPMLENGRGSARLAQLHDLSTTLADDPPNRLLDDGLFVFHLRRYPLFEIPGREKVTFLAYEAAADPTLNPDRSPVSLAQILDAAAKVPADRRRQVVESTDEMLATLDQMEKTLQAHNLQPNWQRLRRVLRGINDLFSGAIAAAPVDAQPPSPAGPESPIAPRYSSPASVPSVIRHREEVLQTLDCLCRYFQQYEPTSPIPTLLVRARRLVGIDFLGAVKELLSEESHEAVRQSLGVRTTPPEAATTDEEKTRNQKK